MSGAMAIFKNHLLSRFSLLVAAAGLLSGVAFGLVLRATAEPPSAAPAPSVAAGAPAAEATVAPSRPLPPEHLSALVRRLQQQVTAARQVGGVTQAFQAQLATATAALGPFQAVVNEAYVRHPQPLFVTGGRPNARAAALRAALDDLLSHGIDPAPFALAEIQRLAAALDELAQTLDPLRAGPAGDATTKTLWSALLAAWDDADPVPVLRDLPAPETALERVADLAAPLADLARAERDATLKAVPYDAALTAAFFRYVVEFKYLAKAHPLKTPDTLEARVPQVAPDLQKELDAALPDMAAGLQRLWPTHPYYERTRQELARYRQLAAEGRIKRVELPQLERNRMHPRLPELKERLRAEGYACDSTSTRFDDALWNAVREFQYRHGLDVVGQLRGETLKAVNVSMEERVQQIALGLQRWRESPVRDPQGYLLRINIPHFMLEVWEGPTLRRLHRVILGANRLVRDPQTNEIGYLNRTHPLSSALSTVVINPTWNVPRRIKQYEIDAQLAKDPGYLEKMGFKTLKGPDGSITYVQRPGKENPLGRVKFVFDNPYSIYLHDTDDRSLFRHGLRTLSHGCIRVDEPMELAKEILKRDQGISRDQLVIIQSTRIERGIDLIKPIPVHIEYNTVSFDEAGKLLLLTDPYAYDWSYFKGRLPARQKREMTPEERQKAIQELGDKGIDLTP